MPQENYTLSVYNPATGQPEEVAVTEAVYNEYRRGAWNIESSNQRFRDHEIVLSDLHGNWENFREFLSECDEPAKLMDKKQTCEQLWKALESLNAKDRSLLLKIVVHGKTERELADAQGVSQNVIHRKKQRIINKLKIFLN